MITGIYKEPKAHNGWFKWIQYFTILIKYFK